VLVSSTECLIRPLTQTPLHRISFESGDFTLPRPLVWILDEPRPHGILSHVFPFLRIALAVTNQMIEKAWLPMRRRRRNCFQ